MKIINLGELELKCVEWGKKKGFLLDAATTEDVSIELSSFFGDIKIVKIQVKGNYVSGCNGLLETIEFIDTTWEDVYYKLNDFFRGTWDYTKPLDIEKAPLYMQITELLKNKSVNGVVKLSDVYAILTEKL